MLRMWNIFGPGRLAGRGLKNVAPPRHRFLGMPLYFVTPHWISAFLFSDVNVGIIVLCCLRSRWFQGLQTCGFSGCAPSHSQTLVSRAASMVTHAQRVQMSKAKRVITHGQQRAASDVSVRDSSRPQAKTKGEMFQARQALGPVLGKALDWIIDFLTHHKDQIPLTKLNLESGNIEAQQEVAVAAARSGKRYHI